MCGEGVPVLSISLKGRKSMKRFNLKKALAWTLLLAFVLGICGCGSATTVIQLTSEDVANMKPYSVTLSFLNDGEGINNYGITWYVADDSANPHQDGIVEIVKVSDVTDESDVFANATTIEATRKTWMGYTYFQADVCDLEDSTQYYWRCGNSLGIYGDTLTLTVGDSTATEFTFMHVSDTQLSDGYTVDKYLHRILKAVTADTTIDFIMNTGDVVQYGSDDSLWKAMLGNTLLSSTPVMAISGNHDYWSDYGSLDGLNETYRHFNITVAEEETVYGAYYSFDRYNVHFVCINAGDLSSTYMWDEQLAWLEEDLANTDADWVVLCTHVPVYSLGKYGSLSTKNSDSLKLQRDLLSIIDGKVDLVLQGHDHMVQYTYPLDSNGDVITTESVTVTDENGITYDQYSLSGGTVYLMSGQGGDQNRNYDTYEGLEDKFAYYLAADDSFVISGSETPTYSLITATADELRIVCYAVTQNSLVPKEITAFSLVK